MAETQETTNQNSQMEALLSQMSERLKQLEQENNDMRAYNLQYQNQIEQNQIKQTPNSSRFRAEVRPMPSLETLIETVTDDHATGMAHILINNKTELSQGE